mgnify:CR=1 FL=1
MPDETKYQDGELIFALDIGTRSIIGVAGRVVDERLEVLAIEKEEHGKRAMLDGQIEDIAQVAGGSALEAAAEAADLAADMELGHQLVHDVGLGAQLLAGRRALLAGGGVGLHHGGDLVNALCDLGNGGSLGLSAAAAAAPSATASID